MKLILWCLLGLLCMADQVLCAQRVGCFIFVDQSLNATAASIESRLAQETKAVCVDALPLRTFTAISTTTHSVGALVLNTSLNAASALAVEAVYFFFFGLDAGWLDAGIHYLENAWPTINAKATYYVAPMFMPVRLWAAFSQITPSLFQTTRPSSGRIVLLDTDPFLVGFSSGVMLAAVTAALERPFVAFWFYEFPETARAAIGFAHGVRDICAACDVLVEGLNYTTYAANMTSLHGSLQLFQALAEQRALSPLTFSPPLVNYSWQAEAPSVLCSSTTGLDGFVVYDVMYVAAVANQSQEICGRVLAVSVNTSLATPLPLEGSETNFGVDIYEVPHAIVSYASNSGLVMNATDPALWSDIISVMNMIDATVADGNGFFHQVGASAWVAAPIGIAWNTPKSALIALGPLVLFADVQFQRFAMYDPRRNLFLQIHETMVSPVVHFVLSMMEHANNTYHVYAVGGFNATVLQLDASTAGNDIYILREMVVQVVPGQGIVPPSYTIVQPWSTVPPGDFTRPTRVGHSVVSYKDTLVAHGGTSPTGADFRGVHIWNATTRSWISGELGLYRHDHSAAVYTDNAGTPWMYVFGGIVGGSIQQTLSKYNLVTDRWYNILTTDVAASNACMMIHEGRIFYYGGIKGTRAYAVISLLTNEIFTDSNVLFGSNLPLDCERAQYDNASITTIASVFGSTALHRLQLPVHSKCNAALNQISNLLMDGCTTCASGSFADETCKPCGALSNTLNPYYRIYCPDTQGESRLRVVLSVSLAVPLCACAALAVLVVFYYQSLDGAAHPPFRNPAMAPIHGQPAALIKVVVDGAPQLWQKAAKHMSTSIESLVIEERRLAAAYGCYEVISAGDASFYTCRSFADALRFALHLHHATETNETDSVIGTLHLRIVLHSGVVDINDAGAEGMHVSGLAVIHARDAAHSKRQPRGILLSDAFLSKYVDETTPEHHAGPPLDQSDLSLAKVSFPTSDHTSGDHFAASVFPASAASAAATAPGDSASAPKPLPLLRGRSGETLMPRCVPLREGFALDINGKRMVCSLEATSETNQSFLGGPAHTRGSNAAAKNPSADPLSLAKLRTAFPGTSRREASSTTEHTAVSMASGEHETDELASATESTSSLSQLFLGWETHPLISMGVLSQREFQCMARIVQRMYEAVLSPLTDVERKLVQDAMAEHLRLYVDSDPMSKQRNRDVAMRVLQIVDMLYIKEVAQSLLGSESDEGTSDGQASSSNAQE